MNTAVERAFRILEHFSDIGPGQGEGVTAVGHILEIPKSSAFELLETLSDLGYLKRTGDRRYSRGEKTVTFGLKSLSDLRYQEQIQNQMELLTGETGFTTVSGVANGSTVMMTAKVSAPGKTPVVGSAGTTFPIHVTAIGKAILSTYDEAEVISCVGPACYASYTRNSITSPRQLLANLAQAKKDGYAIENFEANDYIWGVAAPIVGADGRAISAIGLSAFYHEIKGADRNALAERIRETAARISEAVQSGNEP